MVRPPIADPPLRLAAFPNGRSPTSAPALPKVPELDDKLRLAASLERTLERASALRRHALTLLERDEGALTVQAEWVQPLRVLDANTDPSLVVAGLFGDVQSFLLGRYRGIVGRIDPLFDARLGATIRSAIDELGTETVPLGAPVALAAALEAAWSAPVSARVPLEELMWEPQDRVPLPARPAGRPRPETGSRAHLRHLSRLEADDLAGDLNDNVMAELCAMELLCRCSYEHPDLPWSFHFGTRAPRHRRAAPRRDLPSAAGGGRFCRGRTSRQHGANHEYACRIPRMRGR